MLKNNNSLVILLILFIITITCGDVGEWIKLCWVVSVLPFSDALIWVLFIILVYTGGGMSYINHFY